MRKVPSSKKSKSSLSTPRTVAASVRAAKRGQAPAWMSTYPAGPSSGKALDVMAFVDFVREHPMHVCPAVIAEVIGVHRSTVSKAIREKRVRVAELRLTSGRVIRLVTLADAIRLRPRLSAELAKFPPPKLSTKRRYRGKQWDPFGAAYRSKWAAESPREAPQGGSGA